MKNDENVVGKVTLWQQVTRNIYETHFSTAAAVKLTVAVKMIAVILCTRLMNKTVFHTDIVMNRRARLYRGSL